MHRVAGRETGHRAASPGDNAGGFNAERHGRMPPKVPATGTGDIASSRRPGHPTKARATARTDKPIWRAGVVDPESVK